MGTSDEYAGRADAAGDPTDASTQSVGADSNISRNIGRTRDSQAEMGFSRERAFFEQFLNSSTFYAILQDKVHGKVDHLINRWRTVVGLIAALVLALIGVLGYRTVQLGQAFRDEVADVTRTSDSLRVTVTRFENMRNAYASYSLQQDHLIAQRAQVFKEHQDVLSVQGRLLGDETSGLQGSIRSLQGEFGSVLDRYREVTALRDSLSSFAKLHAVLLDQLETQHKDAQLRRDVQVTSKLSEVDAALQELERKLQDDDPLVIEDLSLSEGQEAEVKFGTTTVFRLRIAPRARSRRSDERLPRMLVNPGLPNQLDAGPAKTGARKQIEADGAEFLLQVLRAETRHGKWRADIVVLSRSGMWRP